MIKCELCEKPAMRMGTKKRGYCFDHDEKAFEQMKKDAKRQDLVNRNTGDELRMQAHRLHVMAGI